MNFIVTDASGQPIADTDVSFTYDGKTYFETTDSQGRIRLRDIAEGTEVDGLGGHTLVVARSSDNEAVDVDAMVDPSGRNGERHVAVGAGANCVADALLLLGTEGAEIHAVGHGDKVVRVGRVGDADAEGVAAQ